MKFFFHSLLICAICEICGFFGVSKATSADVLPGVEVLARDFAGDLAGKRVGILTNPTGVDSNLNSTIDVVRGLKGVKVVRLFSPEHGLRGGYYAGEKVDETRDPVSGLPIASLYGQTRRPTPEMLKDLDVVLYDIQDVGVRHYTFVSTLTLMMEECEKTGVAVWVLDRPEPTGGKIVGGPMIEDRLLSFIGIHNVPLVYGMTPGEWARMIQAERTPKVKLRVIPMKGWRRGMTYGDLGWAWVPPSPHIPRWESCYFYAMTGTIGELGTVNEGVGTPLPFEMIGAPWLDGVKFARAMNALHLPGVRFRPATFTPHYGNYEGKTCQGVQIHVEDFRKIDPPKIEFELMAQLAKIAPEQKIFKAGMEKGKETSGFLPALGDSRLAESLARNEDPHVHSDRIGKELQKFLERRQRCLLYP